MPGLKEQIQAWKREQREKQRAEKLAREKSPKTSETDQNGMEIDENDHEVDPLD